MSPKDWLFAGIKNAIAFAEVNGNWPSRYLKFIYRLSWNSFYNAINPAPRKILIWPRNSFAFNQIVPGLSDIDISIVSENTPHHAIQQWQAYKRRYPWFGEINYYPLQITHELATLGNPGELNRDPELLKYLGKTKLPVSPQQKIAVLIRMFHHDRKALVLHPVARQPKWSYGLKLLDFDQTSIEQWMTQLNFQNCIHEIVKIAPENEREDLAYELTVFHEQMSWLFPQKDAHKAEMKALVRQLSVWKRQLVMEQCYWEFWGVMTQTHWLPKSQIQPHLENIKSLMEACGLPLDAEKYNAMENVFKFIKNSP